MPPRFRVWRGSHFAPPVLPAVAQLLSVRLHDAHETIHAHFLRPSWVFFVVGHSASFALEHMAQAARMVFPFVARFPFLRTRDFAGPGSWRLHPVHTACYFVGAYC